MESRIHSKVTSTYKVENSQIVTSNLSNILFSEEFSDVIIIAGGEGGTPQEKINGHRQILAASSEIFKAMLYGPFVEGSSRELTIPNIEPSIMKALLTFIYTGNVNVEVEQIVSIIKAVDQYCVRGAREEFEKAALHYIDQASGINEK